MKQEIKKEKEMSEKDVILLPSPLITPLEGGNMVVNTANQVSTIVKETRDDLLQTAHELSQKGKQYLNDFLANPGQEEILADLLTKTIKMGALTMQSSLPVLEGLTDESLDVLEKKMPRILSFAGKSATDLLEVIPGAALVMEVLDMSTTIITATNLSLKMITKNLEALEIFRDKLLELTSNKNETLNSIQTPLPISEDMYKLGGKKQRTKKRKHRNRYRNPKHSSKKKKYH